MGALFSGLDDSGEALARAQKRVKDMSTARLMEWMDAALPGLHRHYDMYRRTGDQAHLAEMTLAHMNVGVVLDELMARAQ